MKSMQKALQMILENLNLINITIIENCIMQEIQLQMINQIKQHKLGLKIQPKRTLSNIVEVNMVKIFIIHGLHQVDHIQTLLQPFHGIVKLKTITLITQALVQVQDISLKQFGKDQEMLGLVQHPQMGRIMSQQITIHQEITTGNINKMFSGYELLYFKNINHNFQNLNFSQLIIYKMKMTLNKIHKSIICLISIVFLTQSLTLTQYRTNQLAQHNYYRKLHHVGSLKLSTTLNNIAQKYAQYLLNKNLFKHSGNGYGQNLYKSWSSNPKTLYTSKAATRSWYSQIKDYNFNSPGFSGATGHFTQVVWKGSKYVGFGIATKNGVTVVVANYSPPGNYLGAFATNVFKI